MVNEIKTALRFENITIDDYFIEKVLFWNEELKENKALTIADVYSILSYEKTKKENIVLKQVVEQLMKQNRRIFLDLDLDSKVRTETCYILGYTPDILE